MKKTVLKFLVIALAGLLINLGCAHVYIRDDSTGNILNGMRLATIFYYNGQNPPEVTAKVNELRSSSIPGNLLSKCTGHHLTVIKGTPNFVLEVYFHDKSTGKYRACDLYYITSDGEIGRNNDWYYVPDPFKKWMLKIPPQPKSLRGKSDSKVSTFSSFVTSN